jgi:5-methylcytosine-specific restriction endonuclease McrA
MPRKFKFAITSSRKFESERPEWHLTSGRWRTLRNRWLMQHPTCARCGLHGEEVHHVVPRHVAPHRLYDPTNLMTLCKACHVAEHHGNGPYGERPIEGPQ